MNIKNIAIRRVPIREGSKDLETIARMDANLNCEIFNNECFFNKPDKIINWLVSEPGKLPKSILLAEEESQPKGHVIYSVKDNICLVSSLYVVNGCRGNGIGSKLLNYVIKDAKSKDAYCICVNSVGNSKRFYKHMGFQRRTESGNELSLSI